MVEALGPAASRPVAAVPLYQADTTETVNVAVEEQAAEPVPGELPPPGTPEEDPDVPEVVLPPPTTPEEEPAPED
jgi:hypothetical protein